MNEVWVRLFALRAVHAGFAMMLYYPLGQYCNPKKSHAQSGPAGRSASSCAGNQQQS